MSEVRFLDDVKVLELSNMAPNQLAMHLADLGADVVKIETPRRGDTTRLIGKQPGFNDSMLHRRWNRGKKSVAIDTNTPDGAALLRELVRDVDILIEGFRPGTLQKMGLGWDDLVALNPDLVMVSLSGYGQDGPYRDMGSHGIGFDAIAGLVPVEQDERGHPRVVTRHVNTGTLLAPLFGATAALAALAWSRRTGEPVYLDVAQADAAAFANIGIETAVAREHAIAAGTVTPPPEPAAADGAPAPRPTMQCYRTRDGQMLLMMALERKFFSRLVEAVGRPDLLAHFPEDQYLIQGNAEVDDALVEIIGGRDLAEWMELFAEVDVPVVPLHDTDEAAADPQLAHRLQWLPADQGTVTLGSPVRATPPVAPPRQAAAIGQDTVEVLTSIGVEQAEIDRLEREGVIRITRLADDG
jgi:crotonobetainyl-CoA:carnitine CoA-transferase CaiB-like acyl-CoA transferase